MTAITMPGALAPLLNHLWQATVIGLAAAFTALVLRRYRPAVRYWLWVAASLQFLFPLALLVDVGGLFRWHGAVLPLSAQVVGQAILAPASVAAPWLNTEAPVTAHASLWPLALAGIWFTGFTGIAWGWIAEWRAMRTLVVAASSLDLGLPIRTVSSPVRVELGVFGIFRPVLVVPASLLAYVTGEQLEAILAHEMAHVRRRDNLWAALHHVVKALFWFHPLVWWAGSRMAVERELACDEYALCRGACPHEYAESILRVCRLYAQAPACMAGISGADLKQRVLAIADGAFGRGMGPRVKSLLAGLIVAFLFVPFAAGALGSTNQDPAGAVAYGTASVRPSSPDEHGSGIRNGPEGGLRCLNDSVSFLISYAYDVQDYQISGLPRWATSNRYDVTFTAAGNASGLDADHRERLILQKVLHDRFGVVLRQETRIMPVYTLEMIKPLLKAAAAGESVSFGREDGDPPGQWTATATPMKILTRFLANRLQRPVNDATGLTGKYDFKLTFDPASVRLNAAPTAGADGMALPSLFGALQDQLGLKLETRKGPVPILVVDKVAKPAAN